MLPDNNKLKAQPVKYVQNLKVANKIGGKNPEKPPVITHNTISCICN